MEVRVNKVACPLSLPGKWCLCYSSHTVAQQFTQEKRCIPQAWIHLPRTRSLEWYHWRDSKAKWARHKGLFFFKSLCFRCFHSDYDQEKRVLGTCLTSGKESSHGLHDRTGSWRSKAWEPRKGAAFHRCHGLWAAGKGRGIYSSRAHLQTAHRGSSLLVSWVGELDGDLVETQVPSTHLCMKTEPLLFIQRFIGILFVVLILKHSVGINKSSKLGDEDIHKCLTENEAAQRACFSHPRGEEFRPITIYVWAITATQEHFISYILNDCANRRSKLMHFLLVDLSSNSETVNGTLTL